MLDKITLKEKDYPKLNGPTIKLHSGERLLLVQRKHWIAIVLPMLIHAGILLILLLAFIFAPSFGFFPQISQALIDITLILVSLLAIIGIYTVMDWIFEFYIITDKRIINVHFFKIRGVDFDEYFFTEGAQIEIDRVVSNFIYDLLEIEDIHIGFQSIVRTEHFVIETPSNANQIYSLIEKLFMKKRKTSY